MLSASARSALSGPARINEERSAMLRSSSSFSRYALRWTRMSTLPGSVLLNVIPMHPRVGLGLIASFKKHVFLGLAGHHLDTRRNVLLLLVSSLRRIIKETPDRIRRRSREC